MITYKLNFNPHVVWAQQDGFHVFGYKYKRGYDFVDKIYNYRIPAGNIFEYSTNEHVPTFHFNHVSVRELENSNNIIVFLLHFNHYARIDNNQPRPSCIFFTDSTLGVMNDIFQDQRIGGKTIPTTANFDHNSEYVVFAWGSSLRINDYQISPEPASFVLRTRGTTTKLRGSSACTDAKISPDGNTLAYAVGPEIRFMDIHTKEHKHTLSTNDKVHFLAYSLDGLTLAAITTTKKLIIWDVE